MQELISSKARSLQALAEEVTTSVIAPRAAEVDRDAVWPEHAMQALAAAGLMGLHVPARLGGHQQGLVALVAITETIAQGCSSSALCYGMHCVGTAVVAAKATPYHEEQYLRPIAEGRHITTLALSESGTGSHFYLPQTLLTREEDSFLITGTKQFVTNGGKADSYVVSTQASGTSDAGEFSCVIVDSGAPGLTWLEPWSGFGMRGNSSRGVRLDQARVPAANLLGEDGDQIWYTFEVVAPYFLTAMAGAYLGIARSALGEAVKHLQSRQYSHSGETLADMHVLQHKIAELWIAVRKTRALIYHAAHLGDLGETEALPSILASKADAADTAVAVANEAMTLCGGIAYGENGRLARLLRDARASHVMSPTTDILKLWTGRAVLGLPLL